MPLDDAKKEEIRTKYFADSFSDPCGKKQGKFGQFSLPAPLALGETNMFIPTKNYKGEEGVEIGIRNFVTTKTKKGGTDAVCFSTPPYAFINGEAYVDAGKMKMRDSKPITKPADHDGKPFRPIRHIRQPTNAAFDHMVDTVHVKKCYTDPENPTDVIIEPRNFVTNNLRKGNCTQKGATFGGMHEAMPDDYNYPKALARKELDYHLSKLQEKMFSNRARALPLFNPHKVVYDHWEQDKMKAKPKPERKKNQVEMGTHDKPFFPSQNLRTGIVAKSIGKFPEYMENPLKFTTRKVAEEDAPPPFKSTHKGYTRPSPSVQTNLRNLKASFPSVFRR